LTVFASKTLAGFLSGIDKVVLFCFFGLKLGSAATTIATSRV